MRAPVALAALSLAGMAHAGSIDMVKSLPPGAAAASIVKLGCTDCPPPAPKKLAYNVPALKPGEQKLELRMVNGKEKLFRTDAWLGGSPVVFVSTPTAEMIAELKAPARKPHDPMGDGIDNAAKTAAVPELAPAPPVAAAAAPVPKALDTSGFTLRTE